MDKIGKKENLPIATKICITQDQEGKTPTQTYGPRLFIENENLSPKDVEELVTKGKYYENKDINGINNEIDNEDDDNNGVYDDNRTVDDNENKENDADSDMSEYGEIEVAVFHFMRVANKIIAESFIHILGSQLLIEDVISNGTIPIIMVSEGYFGNRTFNGILYDTRIFHTKMVTKQVLPTKKATHIIGASVLQVLRGVCADDRSASDDDIKQNCIDKLISILGEHSVYLDDIGVDLSFIEILIGLLLTYTRKDNEKLAQLQSNFSLENDQQTSHSPTREAVQTENSLDDDGDITMS
ncbi:hypothetical protein COEREDRAFT_88422 [Coemansia reversa NRRL 1564]|uniref:Uncharacterized protein n=1 Tax=Coemansia reversa (strain ATCC 12441 / NRRL 1564) TaxID=763665 RepID=A0A2G5B7N9_COERN|nr:hypothetical protein COEREDRAFT_88422 [Coemansia reversa NRRL 1564]|eukprot:PIA14737.1 hypothetical protein COEREDRAFT_88422 [Coemansia reversa NRRL 1564]